MDPLGTVARALHVVSIVVLVGGIAPSHVVAGTARRAADPKTALAMWALWFRIGKVSTVALIGMVVTGVALSATRGYGFFRPDHFWLASKQAVLCVALVVLATTMGPARRAERAVRDALREGGGLPDELRALLRKPARSARIVDALAFANLVLALWRPGE